MTNSKENFIFVLEALKRQMDYDKVFAHTISKAFDTEGVSVYNNGILVNTMVAGLCNYFEDREMANREILRFMYELDYGRYRGSDIISAEDLYDRISELCDIEWKKENDKIQPESWRKIFKKKSTVDHTAFDYLYPTNNEVEKYLEKDPVTKEYFYASRIKELKEESNKISVLKSIQEARKATLRRTVRDVVRKHCDGTFREESSKWNFPLTDTGEPEKLLNDLFLVIEEHGA